MGSPNTSSPNLSSSALAGAPRGRRLRRLLALCALGCMACAAERTLTITSEPPGASVRLGDSVIGETPITVDFVHYGPRRITLYKPGYRTNSRRVSVDPPWYGHFPLDVLSEVILPVGWHDRHRVHFALTPGAADERPDLRSVLDRAEVLRRAGPDGPRDLPPVTTISTQRGDATEDEAPTVDDGGGAPQR